MTSQGVDRRWPPGESTGGTFSDQPKSGLMGSLFCAAVRAEGVDRRWPPGESAGGGTCGDETPSLVVGRTPMAAKTLGEGGVENGRYQSCVPCLNLSPLISTIRSNLAKKSAPIIRKATAARRKVQLKVQPPAYMVKVHVPQHGMGEWSAAIILGPVGGSVDV
ncbi:MAG: hypothetical protein FJ333_04315 [Sphingomonadales bacterium]|nr:hypothetical protein [Sphingomonadales bacterium]